MATDDCPTDGERSFKRSDINPFFIPYIACYYRNEIPVDWHKIAAILCEEYPHHKKLLKTDAVRRLHRYLLDEVTAWNVSSAGRQDSKSRGPMCFIKAGMGTMVPYYDPSYSIHELPPLLHPDVFRRTRILPNAMTITRPLPPPLVFVPPAPCIETQPSTPPPSVRVEERLEEHPKVTQVSAPLSFEPTHKRKEPTEDAEPPAKAAKSIYHPLSRIENLPISEDLKKRAMQLVKSDRDVALAIMDVTFPDLCLAAFFNLRFNSY